jgi:hypothetical protein
MRKVLACALATQGAASTLAAPPAKMVRRVMNPLIELHLPMNLLPRDGSKHAAVLLFRLAI